MRRLFVTWCLCVAATAAASLHVLESSTNLLAAAEKGDVDGALAALKAGAPLDRAATHDEANALHLASGAGHANVVAALIAAGAALETPAGKADGPPALYLAAQNGHAAVVETLLRAGASVEGPPSLPGPLYIAAQGGHAAAVRALLGAGARTDRADKTGSSPLHLAAQHGHREVVSALLAAGADVEATNSVGKARPVHLAADAGHAGVVKDLLKHGALVDSRLEGYDDAPTSLMAAAHKGSLRVVKALLAGGASTEAANPGGFTPLSVAVQEGHAQVAAALLAAGARPSAPCKHKGATPLIFAAGMGRADLVSLLLDAGAQVDEADKEGWTAIHAAASGHLPVVQLLLQRGASPRLLTRAGVSPVTLAKDAGAAEVFELLSALAAADIGKPETEQSRRRMDFSAPLPKTEL